MKQLKSTLLRNHCCTSLNMQSLEEALRWIDWTIVQVPGGISTDRIEKVVTDVICLFDGRFPGYRACDTQYHDFEHTLHLFPPFCQLAIALSRNYPQAVTPRDVELGLIAVLLHDSGYIRSCDDCTGTGAKYTFRHIDRSISFAYHYLPSLGYLPHDLLTVKHMISCTGVKPRPEQIEFLSEGSRLLGYALGTADLLGQMSHHNYPQKLPMLFLEFQEAYNYEEGKTVEEREIYHFKNCEELIQNTPNFFKKEVYKRLDNMGSVYHLLDDPETGHNPYLAKIQEHMKTILRSISHDMHSLGQKQP